MEPSILLEFALPTAPSWQLSVSVNKVSYTLTRNHSTWTELYHRYQSVCLRNNLLLTGKINANGKVKKYFLDELATLDMVH